MQQERRACDDLPHLPKHLSLGLPRGWGAVHTLSRARFFFQNPINAPNVNYTVRRKMSPPIMSNWNLCTVQFHYDATKTEEGTLPLTFRARRHSWCEGRVTSEESARAVSTIKR